MDIEQLERIIDFDFQKIDRDYRHDLTAGVCAMPVAQHLGVDVIGFGNGVSMLSMPWTRVATFDGKHIMGGIVGTFADMAAVTAAISGNEIGTFASTTGFTVNMLAPAKGTHFIAIGRSIGSSKAIASCGADVFAINEEKATMIATCLATAKLHMP
jgi:uncharacterized protein (TIGR00369 family)